MASFFWNRAVWEKCWQRLSMNERSPVQHCLCRSLNYNWCVGNRMLWLVGTDDSGYNRYSSVRFRFIYDRTWRPITMPCFYSTPVLDCHPSSPVMKRNIKLVTMSRFECFRVNDHFLLQESIQRENGFTRNLRAYWPLKWEIITVLVDMIAIILW